ncbi:hypothetical protein [Symbiobacterium terraclitae]|uniref:hypothetical protein n=1 Tax=Symbiobacterium terraclitae TaxID=557451 RepID=UPI0035B507BC
MVLDRLKVIVEALKVALAVWGIVQDLKQRRAKRRGKTTKAPRQAPRRRVS